MIMEEEIQASKKKAAKRYENSAKYWNVRLRGFKKFSALVPPYDKCLFSSPPRNDFFLYKN